MMKCVLWPMLKEQYSRANQRKQTTNYYLTYDSIITFYKNAPRFLCALLECSYGGGKIVCLRRAQKLLMC